MLDTRKDTLKVLCWYLYYKCVKKEGVLGEVYLEDNEGSWLEVIFDIIDNVGRFLEIYPECLMKIGHDYAEKKLGPGSGWFRVGFGRGWGFLWV